LQKPVRKQTKKRKEEPCQKYDRVKEGEIMKKVKELFEHNETINRLFDDEFLGKILDKKYDEFLKKVLIKKR
jgi:hypothetical protein